MSEPTPLTAEQLQSVVSDAFKSQDIEGLKKTVAALAEQNKTLLDAQVKQQQEREDNELKSSFPDIPMDLLPAGMSHKDRLAYAAKLMEFKGKTPETQPKKEAQPDWSKAGKASPTLEAEQAAAKADEEKRRNELIASGDPKKVADSILQKSAKTIQAIFKLTPAAQK